MIVLGLQGSPRGNGNTNFLLSAFLKEIEKFGAETRTIEVAKLKISPCIGCGICESTGFCFFNDAMSKEFYPMLREADIIIAATPIFFYNATAQLKIFIDRSQALWSRKYRLNLTDPGFKTRRGFLLALGATKGENLFEGISLTAKYFFDAIAAHYSGNLTYRRIENKGDMEKHPTVLDDIKKEADRLLSFFTGRKKILFACTENACRSQMAAAFARYIAGDKIDAVSGGSKPVANLNPIMVKVMQEKGLDMEYLSPKSIDVSIKKVSPDIIIIMGCKQNCPNIFGAKKYEWDIPDPAGKSINYMRSIRDMIKTRVLKLVNEL